MQAEAEQLLNPITVGRQHWRAQRIATTRLVDYSFGRDPANQVVLVCLISNSAFE
jgi:hypothetical protein